MIVAPQASTLPQGNFQPVAPQLDGSGTQMALAHSKQGPSTISKLAPAAALAGLFLKGSGGMGGVLGSLEGSSLKDKAGGIAASLFQGQAKNTINNELANNLVNLGFENFHDVPQASDVAIPAINNNMTKALANASHVVDMNGFAKKASDLLDNEINVSEPKRQRLLDIMNKLNSTPAAVQGIVGQPNGPEALKELRVLEGIKSKAYSAWQASIRSGRPDEEQHSVYNILRQVTKGDDGLEGRIFSNQGAPLPFDDVTKDEMIKQLEPLKEALPDVYNNMAQKIHSSTNLIEARHLMSDLTQGSIAHDKMQYQEGSKGTDIKSLANSSLGIPALVYSGTGSPLAAVSAGLMQSGGANVGLTSVLRGLAK